MSERQTRTYLPISVFVLLAVIATVADGADGPPVRPHVHLPPTRGAEATSNRIDYINWLEYRTRDVLSSARWSRARSTPFAAQRGKGIRWELASDLGVPVVDGSGNILFYFPVLIRQSRRFGQRLMSRQSE